MIRPLSFACMLLAGGAGLYVYQIKHQAQMLDREIARTIVATDASRARIAMLRAEYALLQEPERLAKLVDQYLPLKTLQPAQFVPLTELASRLPAPLPPGPPVLPEETAPAASLPIAQAAPRPPLMASARPTAPSAGANAASTPRSLLAAVLPHAAAPAAMTPASVPQRGGPKAPAVTQVAQAVLPPAPPAAQQAALPTPLPTPLPLPPVPSYGTAQAVALSSPRQVLAPVLSVLATSISSANAQTTRNSQAPRQAGPAAARPTPHATPGPSGQASGSVLGMAQSTAILPPPVPARSIAR